MTSAACVLLMCVQGVVGGEEDSGNADSSLAFVHADIAAQMKQRWRMCFMVMVLIM